MFRLFVYFALILALLKAITRRNKKKPTPSCCCKGCEQADCFKQGK